MRDIIFRGKRKSDGKWLYGHYSDESVHGTDFPCISPLKTNESDGDWAVIPETVGQYTGLEDKNGKGIFEGDIVTHFSNYLAKRINKAVTFEDGSFMSGEAFLIDWVECGGVNVIGSIHDNPELLK